MGKHAVEFQFCATDFTRKIEENAFSCRRIWPNPATENRGPYLQHIKCFVCFDIL